MGCEQPRHRIGCLDRTGVAHRTEGQALNARSASDFIAGSRRCDGVGLATGHPNRQSKLSEVGQQAGVGIWFREEDDRNARDESEAAVCTGGALPEIFRADLDREWPHRHNDLGCRDLEPEVEAV